MAKASKQGSVAQPPAAEPKWADPPRWSPWVLGAAAFAGIFLAAISTWVHHEVTHASTGYASFCNVNDTVNCDTVVTSPYGMLVHVPVSVWAIGFYSLLLALTVRVAATDPPRRDRARADALALAIAGSLFSAYLAAISAFVLRALCVLCAGLYAVSIACLGAAWVEARPLRQAAAQLLERWHSVRRRPAASIGVASAAIVVLGLSGWLGAQTRLTRAQVFQSNPQFFDWYTSQPIVDTPIDGGYSQGAEKAPIHLVEFSDFECPHCAQAHVTLKDLLPRYQNEVRFTYHNFPLSNECNPAMSQKGHEHACRAAIAADCAAQGGKFPPFANQLFANQGKLDDKSLHDYAKQVGLDVDAFDRCMASSAAAERVAEDVKAGQRAGVRSTPTFFINGRKVEGNLTYEKWLFAFAVELDKS
ncbi:MAG: thioredoxin domain-containing protein [Candidatus Binatia bacterium]